MDELYRRVLAEKENIETALSNLKYTMARNEKTVIELAAIATFLHNIYNGIENILKQVLKAKGIEIPGSAAWHKELLNLSVSQGIYGRNREIFEKIKCGLTVIGSDLLNFKAPNGLPEILNTPKRHFIIMKVLNYRILLRKEPEGGYTVTVPSLPGCVTYGTQ